MEINRIGVVGAGIMGRGVAQVAARAGLEVLLIDLSDELLETAREKILEQVRLQSLFGGSGPVDGNEIIAGIDFSTDYARLDDVDFVVENVTENWEIKKGVYERLGEACPEHAVFAANTSVISIARLAEAAGRPSGVIGIHFMNPVPLKPAVELIRPPGASEKTLEAATSFLGKLGMEWTQVNDSPGFVINRVLMLSINEAIHLLKEGVATENEIDRVFKTCLGHKMGPLETADMIGLDTILNSIQELREALQDDKFTPCPLLEEKVASGDLGQKSGKGFYSYAT